MAGELKHKDVGPELTYAEYHATDSHTIDGVDAGTVIAGKATLAEVKADTDIATAITNSHASGSDNQDLSGYSLTSHLHAGTYLESETDPVFTAWDKDYADLINKPTIPDQLSDLSDDATHRLVTDTEKSTWNGKTDLSTVKADTDVASAISLKHTQGTDQGLDAGGANAVTAAQAKAGYTHSGTAHAPSDAVSLATVKADSDIADAISNSHSAVTVSAPISLSGQALSLVNDAAAAITEIDTGVLANSDTVIPTSKAVTTAIAGASGTDDVARDNIVLLAWKLAIAEGLSIFNLEDGVVDEFEDETGVDTTSSTNENYNSTDDYYSPSGSPVVDNMEYASDALAQAAYVTNSGYDSNTKLYIRFDGSNEATTYTAETGQSVTFAGNKALSTSLYKLGTASVYGTTGYLSLAHSADYTFGSGDFTIELWFRPTALVAGNYYTILAKRAGTAYYGDYLLQADGNGNLVWAMGKNSPAWAINRTIYGCLGINNWYHIAMVRNGSSFYLFINSTLADSVSNSDAMYASGAALYIGGDSNNFPAAGYIDEVRLSNTARWTSAFTAPTTQYQKVLQAYSESTIKDKGSYSLKGIADTSVINKTFTRTVSPAIDLTGVDTLKFGIRSSRTGSNIKIGIHDSGGTTTETTPNITSVNTWQTVIWDISGVADADKNVIDSIIITIVNADSANTFYIDTFTGPPGSMTLVSEAVEAEAEPITGRFLALVEPVDSITVNTDLKGYISNDDGSNFDEVTLTDEGYFDSTKKILSGNVALTDRSDKTMVQKIQTFNNKDLKVHAWGMLWK